MGPFRVARDLGDVLFREGDVQAAVARTHDVVQVIDRRETGLVDRLVHDPIGRLPGTRRSEQEGCPHDVAVLHHDGLSGGGTDVESSDNHARNLLNRSR